MNITISGTTYDASLPVGVTRTHEGGLDQANVVIRHISKQDAFLPFTEVEFLGQWWVIARDDVVRERYIGKATHTIMLVEATKRLERVICGAKTFSRPLVPVYAQRPVEPVYYIRYPNQPELDSAVPIDYMGTIPNVAYSTSQIQGATVEINGTANWTNMSSWSGTLHRENKIVAYSENGTDYTVVTAGSTVSFDTTGKQKLYIRYQQTYSTEDTPGVIFRIDETLYTIDVVLQATAKEPFTIWEVTERLLVTAEPLTDEQSRVYFHTSSSVVAPGAIDTKEIDAPDFSFANGASLKENLDQIAKVLHAKVKMANISGIWVIYYIPLTQNVSATIQGTLIGDDTSFDGAKYAGRIITNAANLVIDNTAEGAISDPCGNSKDMPNSDFIGGRTLRCADNQARINAETGEIATVLPIRKINKVLVFIPKDATASEYYAPIDISAYIIEEAEYGVLSNYTQSLHSKSHHLYYKKGLKNIFGLFFKPSEDYVPDALKKYAIVNIINDVSGGSYSSFSNYKDIVCNVEYEPYMNLMLMNSREDGKGGTVNYIANQAGNEVDKEALAAFARGTIEQMASDSPKKTYLMQSLASVPQVGTMFDATHYISEVSFQIYPYFVKCTLSISEHYNRLGEHVEVANHVRQYEIDVNNVYDRNILYADVCNVSLSPLPASYFPPLLNEEGRTLMLRHLKDRANDPYVNRDLRLSVAEIDTLNGYHEKNVLPDVSRAGTLQQIMLPVASFGFGNSLVFAVPFEDNFAAGAYASHEGLDETKQYNLRYLLQYGDAYGDVDFLSLKLRNGVAVQSTVDNNPDFLRDPARALPQSIAGMPGVILGDAGAETESGSPVVIYKDGRERIIFIYQVLFQSDSGVVIGSDFASWCPLVRDYSTVGETLGGALLYLYADPNMVDPIKGITETGSAVASRSLEIASYSSGAGIYLQATEELPSGCASWAIIKNGKFMLGGNFDLKERATGNRGRLYFNVQHQFQ